MLKSFPQFTFSPSRRIFLEARPEKQEVQKDTENNEALTLEPDSLEKDSRLKGDQVLQGATRDLDALSGGAEASEVSKETQERFKNLEQKIQKLASAQLKDFTPTTSAELNEYATRLEAILAKNLTSEEVKAARRFTRDYIPVFDNHEYTVTVQLKNGLAEGRGWDIQTGHKKAGIPGDLDLAKESTKDKETREKNYSNLKQKVLKLVEPLKNFEPTNSKELDEYRIRLNQAIEEKFTSAEISAARRFTNDSIIFLDNDHYTGKFVLEKNNDEYYLSSEIDRKRNENTPQ